MPDLFCVLMLLTANKILDKKLNIFEFLSTILQPTGWPNFKFRLDFFRTIILALQPDITSKASKDFIINFSAGFLYLKLKTNLSNLGILVNLFI